MLNRWKQSAWMRIRRSMRTPEVSGEQTVRQTRTGHGGTPPPIEAPSPPSLPAITHQPEMNEFRRGAVLKSEARQTDGAATRHEPLSRSSEPWP